MAVAGLASAVLVRLSFPEPGWFALAWVALVPWLVVLRTHGRGASLAGSAVMGLAASGLGLSWQYIVTVPGGIGLTIYVALYVPLFAALLRVACGALRVPMPLAAPVLWTGLEYLRSWLFTGFPWLFLGHTQQPWTLLVQACDLVGAYGLSFLVMGANALVAEAAVLWGWRRELPPLELRGRFHGYPMVARGPKERPVLRLAASAVLVAALLAGALGYGAWRLPRLDNPPGPRVGIVQANIPQEVKNVLTLENICDIFFAHWATTLRLQEQAGGEPLDLIVWPESMVQWPLNQAEPPDDPDFPALLEKAAARHGVALPAGVPPSFRHLLWALARQMGCPLLVGAHTIVGRDETLLAPHAGRVDRITETEIVFDGESYPLPHAVDPVTGVSPRREVFVRDGQQVAEHQPLLTYESIVFNSAYLFRPEAGGSPVKRYDKIHLVPFGEYVPLPSLLWFVKQAVPYAKGFSAWDEATLFEVGRRRFGVLICFEDAFPRVVRRFVVRDGEAGADFLINISNDGWFKGSHELAQHLAICALRAVEFRTGIVRCTNTGISGILEPDGTLQTVVQDAGGDRKEVRGTAIGHVRLRTETTFYARHGDLLGQGCLALGAVPLGVGVGAALARGLRRRARSTSTER